jgi:hypothetical protein
LRKSFGSFAIFPAIRCAAGAGACCRHGLFSGP